MITIRTFLIGLLVAIPGIILAFDENSIPGNSILPSAMIQNFTPGPVRQSDNWDQDHALNPTAIQSLENASQGSFIMAWKEHFVCCLGSKWNVTRGVADLRTVSKPENIPAAVLKHVASEAQKDVSKRQIIVKTTNNSYTKISSTPEQTMGCLVFPCSSTVEVIGPKTLFH